MIIALPIVLSSRALGFSIYVFFDNRKRDQRNVFLKVHERLLSDDLQRGRYLLFEKVSDEASVARLREDEYRDINRALATYEALGLYLKNGYVIKRDVMDLWAEAIYRAWHAAQPFIAHREHNHGYRPWPHFEALARASQDDLTHRGITMQFRVWRQGESAPPGGTGEPETTTTDPSSHHQQPD